MKGAEMAFREDKHSTTRTKFRALVTHLRYRCRQRTGPEKDSSLLKTRMDLDQPEHCKIKQPRSCPKSHCTLVEFLLGCRVQNCTL